MAANQKSNNKPLEGPALVKEVCRLIRLARTHWDAHNNKACRGERERAVKLYETLTPAEKEKIPQVLRVWLRYRSEKNFGHSAAHPKKQRARPVGGGDRVRTGDRKICPGGQGR